MITKSYVKSRDVVKVKFEIPLEELPADLEVESVHLVGDFNGWDEGAHPFSQRRKSDPFTVIVEMDPGRVYFFRYLVNGEQWVNAWDADGYRPNEFGEDDCILDLIV